MMHSGYIKALETRAKWLRFAQDRETWDNETPKDVQRMYRLSLETGDTFFMNQKFCSLVDHARQSVPDEMEFDAKWLQSPRGWMWLEEPFIVPPIAALSSDKTGMLQIKIAAIAWFAVSKVTELYDGVRYSEITNDMQHSEAVTFLCFSQLLGLRPEDNTFACWSYFTLKTGDKLSQRITDFEGKAIPQSLGDGMNKRISEAYVQSPEMNKLHEIRWLYSAMYLMSQRLAMNVRHDTDRSTRRRGERENAPVAPFLRVVTLRRLEEAREKAKVAGEPVPVDWQWQWEVQGHWRNQYFPATKEHKPVFVEAYIKGPEDKPLKPPGAKLFVARR